MATMRLIIGGARSGKSAYAQKFAESIAGPRVYLATCVPTDNEMTRRVRLHQDARKKSLWTTVEEPLELAHVVRTTEVRVLLIDCISMWVSNLTFAAKDDMQSVDEKSVTKQVAELITAARSREGDVIFVTGEVGMGIVPQHPLSRLYRDLLGTCNQTLAAHANVVTHVTCGLPMILKEELF